MQNGMGKSIFYESRQYRGGMLIQLVNHFRQKLATANLEAVEGANDRSKYMCFMINRSICEDRMHYPDHRRLMCPPTRHYSCVFFVCFFFVCFFFSFRDDARYLQIKASKIAEVPL